MKRPPSRKRQRSTRPLSRLSNEFSPARTGCGNSLESDAPAALADLFATCRPSRHSWTCFIPAVSGFAGTIDAIMCCALRAASKHCASAARAAARCSVRRTRASAQGPQISGRVPCCTGVRDGCCCKTRKVSTSQEWILQGEVMDFLDAWLSELFGSIRGTRGALRWGRSFDPGNGGMRNVDRPHCGSFWTCGRDG